MLCINRTHSGHTRDPKKKDCFKKGGRKGGKEDERKGQGGKEEKTRGNKKHIPPKGTI